MQYYQCPRCGANLDPGEKCDCLMNEEKFFENSENEQKEVNRRC